MAYTPKAGSFTLFKNDYKTQDNHPDWRGDGLDIDGNPIEVSGWIKQGAKGEFISCSSKPKVFKPKEAQQAKPVAKASKPVSSVDFSKMDDEIPF